MISLSKKYCALVGVKIRSDIYWSVRGHVKSHVDLRAGWGWSNQYDKINRWHAEQQIEIQLRDHIELDVQGKLKRIIYYI